MPHDPLTHEDLDEIEQRTAKATPGPWTVYEDDWGHYRDNTGQDRGHGYHVFESQQLGDGECGAMLQPDAEFVAAARADVPRLVAEVRRLRAALCKPGHCAECDWTR